MTPRCRFCIILISWERLVEGGESFADSLTSNSFSGEQAWEGRWLQAKTRISMQKNACPKIKTVKTCKNDHHFPPHVSNKKGNSFGYAAFLNSNSCVRTAGCCCCGIPGSDGASSSRIHVVYTVERQGWAIFPTDLGSHPWW